MFEKIRISVDGLDGAIAARSAGIRLVTPSQELTLTGYHVNRDGRPGTDASQATIGGPAGFLAVQLSESSDIPQGVRVDIIDFESRQQPPTFAEIPAGRDVLFTAVGGDGEPGRNGGDGENGMAGEDGASATRELDAVRGTNGGNGGDAGRGTNGADGGHGGYIRVYLDENNTHLLLATHHDTSGGKGGVSGSHGRPGQGGQKGKGGAGHIWSETIYKYNCTSSCIGRLTHSPRTDLVRAGPRVDSSILELMAPVRAQAVQGGNLQARIAQLAARYGALTHQNVNKTRNCRCSGGEGNCIGCESEPIILNFQRVKANDGCDGRPGAVISDSLVKGTPGKDGSFTIIVRSCDGGEQEYPSRYNLELVDFDIEDENGDGIFEPGEHIMVRRIRIRNTGGMPSPTCHIPLSVCATDWLVPLPEDAGHAFIPPSIDVGSTATVEGSIKVLIRRKRSPPEPGKTFSTEEVLSIKATMPWLDRELPHFEFRRTFVLQYPIELRQFKYLTTLAQGSQSSFAWEVYNKSARPLGSTTSSRRSIEIAISFPDDCGNLLSSSHLWTNNVLQHVPSVPPSGASPLQQRLQIFPIAKSYRHVLLRIELFILAPGQEQLIDRSLPKIFCSVHTHNLRIQISSHHIFNPRSSILLVTNTDAIRNKIQAVRNFIENEMKLQMDEWNVGLYGGLQYRPDEGESLPSSVLTTYQGKTIVFLGNRFKFFGSGPRKIAELCDIRSLAEATCNGTTCLFLGLAGESSYNKLLNGLIFPVPSEASVTTQLVRPSDECATMEVLAESVRQEKLFGSTGFTLYTIPIQARWYKFGKAKSKDEAEKVSKFLRRVLPQERFLITPVKIETAANMPDGGGFVSDGIPRESSEPSKKKQKALAVLHGSSRQLSVCAIEESRNVNAINNGFPQINSSESYLDYFESYSIAASLPVSHRVKLAWHAGADLTEGGATNCSAFALNAIVISLQRGINLEIQTFLREADGPQVPQPNTNNVEESKNYLRLHFPILATLLQYRKANTEFKPPEPIIEILHSVEASCLPQKKREIAQKVPIIGLWQRRSQLRDFIIRMINELLMRKEFTVQEIKEFHCQACAFSKTKIDNRTSCNTEDVIIQRAMAITKISNHAFRNGQKNATDVFPRTIHYTNDEWNAQFMMIETSSARMNADTEKAWEALGNMVLPFD